MTLVERQLWAWGKESEGQARLGVERESLMIVKKKRKQDPFLDYKHLCMGFKKCFLWVTLTQCTHGLGN